MSNHRVTSIGVSHLYRGWRYTPRPVPPVFSSAKLPYFLCWLAGAALASFVWFWVWILNG